MRKIDFAISSLSKTKERTENFYFSNHYSLTNFPSGVLIKLKNSPPPQGRPILAVWSGGVHSEYALNNLQNEYIIQVFASFRLAANAFKRKSVDRMLLHPEWFQYPPLNALEFEICSKLFQYPTHTGILFHKDSDLWLKPVNQAVDRMLEDRNSKKLTEIY